MKRYIATTGSITYAIKGKELLKRHGYNAKIERRSSGIGSSGCGYSIIFDGDASEASSLLDKAGIRIIELNELTNFS